MHIIDSIRSALVSEFSTPLTRSGKRPDHAQFDRRAENDDPRLRGDFLDRIRRYEHPIDYESA